jgi:hypothetical protein
MNEINGRQLGAMLLISDVYFLFCLKGSISPAALTGFLAASALQLLFALGTAASGGASVRPKLFFLGYSVFLGGLVFSSLWSVGGMIYISCENGCGIWGRLVTAALVTAVCIYISHEGIKPAARASVIAAAAGALCLAADLAGSVSGGEWKHITELEGGGMLSETVRGFALSGGTGSFAILLGSAKGNRGGMTAGYFAAKAAVSSVVLLTAMSAAGRIAEITERPVITAMQLSQPFEAQRIDALFLVMFVVFAVFSAALYMITAAWLMKELSPRFEKYRSTAAATLMTVAALVISGRELILLRAVLAVSALLLPLTGIKRSAAGNSG